MEKLLVGVVGVGMVLILLLICVAPFTGIPINNGHGQYTGYVTAVEQNGMVFKGWNVYLKTELDSSNEDKACVNRDDKELLEDLVFAQDHKENITVTYESELIYRIGKCPGTDWMVMSIK